MAKWIQIFEKSYFRGEVLYDAISDPKTNSTTVTVSKMRVRMTEGYFYNNYGPEDSRSAKFGLSVGTKKTSKRIKIGTVEQDWKEISFTPISETFYHNDSGELTYSVGGYTYTNTGYGDIGWGSKSIIAPKLDHVPAGISINYKNRTVNSITYIISTNKKLSNIEYNTGSAWISINKQLEANTSIVYTITGLAPNTVYNIQWRGITEVNNMLSLVQGDYGRKTDAEIPTVSNFIISNITTDSATATLTGKAGVNDSIKSYNFSLDKVNWSGWQASNSYTFNNLKSNTSFIVYGQIKAESGKISATQASVSFKTDSIMPTIGDLKLIKNTTNSLTVEISSYSSQLGILETSYYINGNLYKTFSGYAQNCAIVDLKPYTSYNIYAIIKEKDKERIAQTKIVNFKTKATLPIINSVNISDVTNNGFSVSCSVTSLAPIIQYSFGTNGAYINKNINNHSFNSLLPNTSYEVKIRVKDESENIVESSIQIIKTLPPVPLATISEVIVDTYSVLLKFIPNYSNGRNIKYINYTCGEILQNNIPFTTEMVIKNLEPNTLYTFTYTLIDKDGQTSEAKSIQFKTLEDKWVQISVNGSEFKKVSLFIIQQNGQTIKILKSKRQIIK